MGFACKKLIWDQRLKGALAPNASQLSWLALFFMSSIRMQLHQDSKPAKSVQGEKRQRTKQTLWGMDAEQEPIGIYPRRVCVGFAFSAASEATSE